MFRNNRITFRGKPVMVVAIEMESVSETARSEPVAGDADDMYREAAAGEGVIVVGQPRAAPRPEPRRRPRDSGARTESSACRSSASSWTIVDQQGTIFMDRTRLPATTGTTTR